MVDPLAIIARQLQSGDGVLVAALILLTYWSLCRLLILTGVLPRRGRWARFAGATWAIGSLLGFEQAYEFVRGQIPLQTDVAIMHAYRLLDLEWQHGFFVESRLERFFLHYHALMEGIDLFYVVGHVGVTIAVLVWVYFWHREQWPLVRNLMMLTTAIALVAFYLYPTAPPRMLGNYGFVDPTISNHLVGAGGAQPSSYTYNPYAAMPSLHVGYALVAAWAVFAGSRRVWLRLLAAIYPVLMTADVIISANHLFLDIVGAILTVLLARSILLGFSLLRGALPAHLPRPAS